MHFQEDGDGKLSHLGVWRCVGTIGGGAAANVGGVIFGGVDGLGAIVGVDGLERRWAVGVGRIMDGVDGE